MRLYVEFLLKKYNYIEFYILHVVIIDFIIIIVMCLHYHHHYYC